MSTSGSMRSREPSRASQSLAEPSGHVLEMSWRFLAAHERAMAELEDTQGTAEDQAKRLQVLSVEKNRLTDKVEELEDALRLEKEDFAPYFEMELSGVSMEFNGVSME